MTLESMLTMKYNHNCIYLYGQICFLLCFTQCMHSISKSEGSNSIDILRENSLAIIYNGVSHRRSLKH